MGTMAFGSILIATMNMIKIVFEYFVAKAESAKATTNPVVKALICMTRCCIWCLDSCVKHLNKNAYIQCALFSTPFCKSAKEGFYLFIRNGARFTSLNVIGTLISLLGKGIIIALSCYICILITDSMGVQYIVVFAAITGVVAFVISSLFL
jgi:choline transporter-like protein 2/4/5